MHVSFVKLQLTPAYYVQYISITCSCHEDFKGGIEVPGNMPITAASKNVTIGISCLYACKSLSTIMYVLIICMLAENGFKNNALQPDVIKLTHKICTTQEVQLFKLLHSCSHLLYDRHVCAN